jgi:RimJ/RimL family protein N-acetyltransferase
MNETRMATERLVLRPRTAADIEDNLDMDMDPAVHRFIWGNTPPDRETQRRKIRDQIATGWPHRGGFWVVERKDERGFLGWCCLVPLEDSGLIEIGYRYVREAWGQGYATEAARRILDHGFRKLGIDPIVAVTHPQNLASQNVLLKIGLQRNGTAFHYGQDVAFFRLDAEDYRGGQTGRRALRAAERVPSSR